VIVPSYSFIDASTGDYQEEEIFYQEEEEENFDHLTNQGKLIIFQNAKLYKSKASPHFILCLIVLSQVFTLQALLMLIYQSYFLIYDSLGLE
jgi:hypothetical protein